MPRRTGTKVERDEIRRKLARLGAAPDAVAAELQRRFGLRPREAYRQAHGLTQDAVAAQLNASSTTSAAYTGARISDYERWPVGGRRPTLHALIALATVYGTTPTALVDLDDLAAMPETERSLLLKTAAPNPAAVEPWTAAPFNVSGEQGRAVRWNVGDLLDETELIIAVTERTSEFGAWAESSNVGPLTLDDLAASTRRIASDYLTRPPVPIYARAGLLADRVFRLLQTGHQHPDQTRELYTWAGYLCTLLAWMAGDLGHHAAAESQARTSWVCAEMAHDDTLRAWVLSTMSKVHLWDQRFEDAAAMAAQGLAHAPNGTASVMLACQEADAWAEIGAADPAQKALDRAEDARQRVGTDTVGGLLACGEIRHHNYAGAVLLRIGQPVAAIRHAELALSAAAGDSTVAYGTLSQIRIWAASAHIAADTVDGAVEVLSPVLKLPTEQRLDTVARRLREVDRLISSKPTLRTSPEARGLQAAIRDFCAGSVSRQLPA
ncbi:helix-turn-helix domain-containing protein [Dactylosporangium sp. NPDC000521]|uniref:helix-turn-helix domain-containing protein n=1 Tax=Dactylosporangium sp. NPDC000521 TaxID=3363975 RepID=UPI003693621E